ncbi:MAG: glycosyl transferase family 2 [Alphaproteobacteria bacterium]|nr:glycosyl transferase family 2 [Alphaproteobacteria bacterium]
MGIRHRLAALRTRATEDFRSASDPGLGRALAFRARRLTREHRAAFEKDAPLVSMCIATYNRATLVKERAIASALAQTYANLEIIVVGDHCTDATEEVVGAIDDPRLTFVNLPSRGQYPENPRHRWMVAGSAAMNHALRLAKGDFITHLDDDDEHPAHRVEALLDAARRTRADFVFHPFEWETAPGEWTVNPAGRFAYAQVTTSSVFYHHSLRSVEWDLRAWRFEEPGDWNRFRRIRFLGPKVARHPEILLRHYKERSQS